MQHAPQTGLTHQVQHVPTPILSRVGCIHQTSLTCGVQPALASAPSCMGSWGQSRAHAAYGIHPRLAPQHVCQLQPPQCTDCARQAPCAVCSSWGRWASVYGMQHVMPIQDPWAALLCGMYGEAGVGGGKKGLFKSSACLFSFWPMGWVE